MILLDNYVNLSRIVPGDGEYERGVLWTQVKHCLQYQVKNVQYYTSFLIFSAFWCNYAYKFELSKIWEERRLLGLNLSQSFVKNNLLVHENEGQLEMKAFNFPIKSGSDPSQVINGGGWLMNVLTQKEMAFVLNLLILFSNYLNPNSESFKLIPVPFLQPRVFPRTSY